MNPSTINIQPLPDDFKLREVQVIGIDMVKAEFIKGIKKVLVHMSTGTGKSILSGMIIRKTLEKNPDSYCFFIVPRITLLWQTKGVFESIFGFDCGVIQGSQPIDLSKNVQLATIQSLTNRLKSKNESFSILMKSLDVKLSIHDEAHLMYKGIEDIEESWDCHMLALSATPFSKGLGKFWTSMVRPKKMSEVMKEGIITDYRVKACVPINRANLKTTSTGEYNEKDVDKETSKIVGDVIGEYLESDDMKGRLAIGFAPSIKTCIALSELFNEKGVNSAFVHSKMSDDDVADVLVAFKDGLYRVVWSVIKLCEGLDIPEVSAIIDCTPLAPSKHDKNIPNSASRYVQKTGRGTRAFEGKDSCLIHDHAGNFLQYGCYEEIENLYPELDKTEKGEPKELDAKERMEKAVKECPACGMVMKGVHCNICGHVLKKPTQFLEAGDLDFIDGKMIEIKKTKRESIAKPNMTMEEKIDIARQLKGHCMQKKQTSPNINISGYFAHKYKSLAGVWPRNETRYELVKAKQPSPALLSWIKSENIRWANRKKSA